jgi:ornithine cyclodeaminase/alanine dehydrogenase-like protein (mu-crystallin family)
MRFVDADQLRAAAPMPQLLDAIEAAYRDVAAERDRSPIRSRIPMAGGDLLLMPGLRDGGAGASVKLVTVMPGNAARASWRGPMPACWRSSGWVRRPPGRCAR